MEITQKSLLVLTIIGAINWGLIGIFGIDLVATIFGEYTMLSRIIYTVIAICGLINIGILISHIEYKKD